jgi:hypothetical protein
MMFLNWCYLVLKDKNFELIIDIKIVMLVILNTNNTVIYNI